MSSNDTPPASPIRVGAVGIRPGEHDGILAELPQGDMFQFVAFSDEGLEDPGVEYRPAAYYSDYNLLLRDPTVELVLVDGPVARRRDFALRALSSGRPVVLAPPFCEAAAGAERVMKTALRRGLAATMDMPWRGDVGLRALRAALAAENVGDVHGLLASLAVEPPAESDASPVSLLGAVGMALLDQVHLLLSDDVKSVTAHLRRPAPGSPEDGFLVYMP
ncbi:MAG: Gfo/Idh/MocA family oxidoreductase, partial [Planctomycetota bacterium]